MKYTPEDKEQKTKKVFELAAIMSVRNACKETGVPIGTFLDWVTNDQTLPEQYARARSTYHDSLADEIMTLADEEIDKDDFGKTDNGLVQQRRTQIDARKWYLSKVAPKQYGDRLTLAGDEDNPVAVTAVELKVIDNKQKQIEDGT